MQLLVNTDNHAINYKYLQLSEKFEPTTGFEPKTGILTCAGRVIPTENSSVCVCELYTIVSQLEFLQLLQFCNNSSDFVEGIIEEIFTVVHKMHVPKSGVIVEGIPGNFSDISSITTL